MIFNKVLKVYRNEGLVSVIKSTLAYLFQNILSYETYYLTKLSIQSVEIKQKSQTDFIDKLTFKHIKSNAEADEIAKEFEDFRSYTTNAKRILDAGGIAFCQYVGKEAANTCWIATSKTAMKTMTDLPMRVDFDNNEVYSGYMYSVPKYRRSGLRYSRQVFRYGIMKEMGLEIRRSAIRTNNFVALYAAHKTGQTAYAKARYLRILGLKLWKESPMNSTLTDVLDKMSGKEKKKSTNVS